MALKQWFKSALFSLGYEIRGVGYLPRQLRKGTMLRALEFDDVVCRRIVEVGSAFTFIQIGVLDGITGDPIRKYIERFGWRGILVEPQANAAGRLRELYQANDGITVLQGAIDREAGRRALFTVTSGDRPEWAGGLASFDRDIVLKHSNLVPGLQDLIREERVECITFEDVLRHLPSSRLDLLQIDTEGADAEILSVFPFERLQPSIVHWEVKHLSVVKREECLDRLGRFGYQFAPSGAEDMIAVR